ncbi:glycosyltransferase family 2 protein, partial [Patescibacteria group bacterium]|nr:glycosyltransferase family 2 protein [Patescibacteria group bacterium]
MDLSIIIVSWNVSEYLKRCLKSIYQAAGENSQQVIVIDNNSSDKTKEMLEQEFPQVNLISNKKNLGFAKACNQGLAKAGGRYLLLLNPDTEIIDDALDEMVEFMNKNPEVGIAGCKLLNEDRTIQPSVRRFPSFLVQLGMMFKLHHLVRFKSYLAKDLNYNQIQEVEQLMGAFMIIRRDVFKEIGYFDDKYHLWFEEVDYCLRARKHGFKVVYTPAAQIIHYGGQSFKQTHSFKKQFYFSLSRLHYLRKHHNFLTFIVIFLLTPISLFLTLINSLFF